MEMLPVLLLLLCLTMLPPQASTLQQGGELQDQRGSGLLEGCAGL